MAATIPVPQEKEDVTTVRLALKRAGFAPLPAIGKIVRLPEWSAKHDVGDDEIVAWAGDRRLEANTGILTARTPALDIDITDPEAAQGVEDLVHDRYGDHGRVLTRFGMPPKRALLFCTNTPFKKIRVDFTAPNGVKHGLEVLGDGQQIIVHGAHPTANRPYRWIGGIPGIVRCDELPALTEKEARELVAEATALLTKDFGFRAGEAGTGRDGPIKVRSTATWRALVADDVGEGNRNKQVTSLTGHLLQKGVDVFVVLELMQAWNLMRCQPPLPTEDVETIVNSIAGKELRRRGVRHG